MKSSRCFVFFLLWFSFLSLPAFAATGRKAMVATANSYATDAALEILRQGGNAVDAAVAAQWVLNVTEPQSSGIGGGGFFLYYEAATKKIYAFDGRETAPAGAFPEMFLGQDRCPARFKPDCVTGGLSVGVPGTLRLLHTVHGRFASRKFSFAGLFEPAIRLAEGGFPVSERVAFYIDQEKDRLKLFKASRRVFLDRRGNPIPEGTLLLQPDLAKTFRLIQKQGPDIFYQGEIGRDIVKAVREAPYHPGKMREADLAAYRVVQREPVSGSYRGYTLFSMGPPSSGGTTLIETLHILEQFPLKEYFPTQRLHLFAEAQKLAFRDRNLLAADPDFIQVPLEKFLSKKAAQKAARAIQMDTAIPEVPAPSSKPLNANAHTSHLSIADAQGNRVAFTTTIEEMFGSGMMVPGRGFFLNNELTDFDLELKKDGRLRANAVQGGKRPRSSMTPTFIFKEGKPFLIIGSPGGSKIIGAVLNVVVNMIDFDMPLEQAMRMPRLIDRDGPMEMETDLFKDLRQRLDLGAKGHRIVESTPIGNVQAISFNQDGSITGSSDPRGEGEAKGY